LAERGALAQQMEASGVEVLCADTRWTKTVSPLNYSANTAIAFGKLCAAMRTWRPNIAHFYLPRPYLIGAPAAIAARVPIKIMSRRSLSCYQEKRLFVAGVERALHGRMDRVVGNSRAVVNELRKEGVPENKLRLIYNGIDVSGEVLDRSAARIELGLPRDAIVGVHVANLIHYKGHRDLIEGVARIAEQLPLPWCILLAGRDEGLGAELKALAADRGIASNIHFLGERSDVHRLLAAADFGFLTSHEEGFSNVILEGMSAGLAMIVTDTGGNPEAVLHERTGLIIPPRDPTAIGEATMRLARDAELRTRFGEAGRSRVMQEFSLDRCVQAHHYLYDELLAKVHAARTYVTPSRRTVLHVITGLDLGGAERMLTRVVLHDRSPDAPQHIVISLADEGHFGSTLQAAGIELHCLGLHNPLRLIAGVLRLPLLMRRIRPDSVMTWLYHADFLGTLAAIASGVGAEGVVWNLRCSNVDLPLSGRIIVKLLAWLSPLPWGVAANSRAGIRTHEALGYRPRRWLYLPNGVELDIWQSGAIDREEVRSELGISPVAQIVGMVGRRDPQKDHATFLAAAKLVATRHPQTRFVLAGRGTDEIPNADWLLLLGERHDIPRLMRALDIFVLSSCYGEGSSNVIAEAMASEVPCIVTDVGDSAALVEGSGIVVPCRDAEALAAAIDALLSESSGIRADRGRRGRETIQRNYSLKNTSEMYQQLWQSMPGGDAWHETERQGRTRPH
jgi:glycosyltransferase involved in cell wall biosynthesis